MNIVLIITLVVIAFRTVSGYRKGIVEEVIALLALVSGVFVLALVAAAIDNYLTGHISDMLIAIVSLLILIIAIQVSRLIFSSLKIITKIPVIRGVNKLAGLAAGLAEGIILVWIGFIVVEKFNFGGYAAFMLSRIQDNAFLSLLYQNNYIRFIMKI